MIRIPAIESCEDGVVRTTPILMLKDDSPLASHRHITWLNTLPEKEAKRKEQHEARNRPVI